MTYSLEYSADALTVLNGMSTEDMHTVVDRLVEFAKNPNAPGASKPGRDGLRIVTVLGIASAECFVHHGARQVITLRILRIVSS